MISYLDEKLGRLLDALEESGQLEDTVIVHLSDHGEMNGEHGLWRKSVFYEASVRVPLQIAWPGQLPAGARIPQVVSLVDVVATLLDIAGVEPPAPLDGDSLLPLLRGHDAAWKDRGLRRVLRARRAAADGHAAPRPPQTQLQPRRRPRAL